MPFVNMLDSENPISVEGNRWNRKTISVGMGGIDTINSITDTYKLLDLERLVTIENVMVMTEVLEGAAPVINIGYRKNVKVAGKWEFGTEWLTATTVPTVAVGTINATILSFAPEAKEVGITFSVIPTKMRIHIAWKMIDWKAQNPNSTRYSVSLATPE